MSPPTQTIASPDLSNDPLKRITRLAELSLGVSTAIVDTEYVWSRSSRGLEAEPVGRRRLAIAPDTPFVVDDATAQAGFTAPVVPDVSRPRFYAGVALRTADGASLGTLCLIDSEPRHFTDRQLMTLIEIAGIAADTLELRLASRERPASDRAEPPTANGAERRDLQGASLQALILALDAHDAPTSDHCLAVVALARSVATAMALPSEQVTEVAQVALLHDVGKVGIPDAILHKRGHLDGCERSRMRQHPVIGEKIVSSLRELRHLAPAIRAAHERWAGGGYPDGLQGKAIPIASRIVFACDAYDAMTTDRTYQAAASEVEARDELLEHAGTQFDPEVIERLVRVLDTTPEPHPRSRSVSRFTAEGWISQALR
jgi:hypothetical protein